jgi:hypothetical protein
MLDELEKWKLISQVVSNMERDFPSHISLVMRSHTKNAKKREAKSLSSDAF